MNERLNCIQAEETLATRKTANLCAATAMRWIWAVVILAAVLFCIAAQPALAQTGTFNTSLEMYNPTTGGWTQMPNTVLTIYNNITASDLSATLTNAYAIVTFPKKWVTPDSVRAAEGTITADDTNYTIRWNIAELSSGANLGYSFNFKMIGATSNYPTTPINYPLPITSTLYNSAGGTLTTSSQTLINFSEVKFTVPNPDYSVTLPAGEAASPGAALLTTDETKLQPVYIYAYLRSETAQGVYCGKGHRVTVTLPAGAQFAAAAAYAVYWKPVEGTPNQYYRGFPCTSWWGNSQVEKIPVIFPGGTIGGSYVFPYTVDLLDENGVPLVGAQKTAKTTVTLAETVYRPGLSKAAVPSVYYMTEANRNKELFWIGRLFKTYDSYGSSPYTIYVYGLEDRFLDYDLYFSGFGALDIPTNFAERAKAARFKVYGVKLDNTRTLLHTSATVEEAAQRVTIDYTGFSDTQAGMPDYRKLVLEFDEPLKLDYAADNTPLDPTTTNDLTWNIFTKVKPELYDKNGEVIHGQFVTLNTSQSNVIRLYSGASPQKPNPIDAPGTTLTETSASPYIYIWHRGFNFYNMDSNKPNVSPGDSVAVRTNSTLGSQPDDILPSNMRFIALLPRGFSLDTQKQPMIGDPVPSGAAPIPGYELVPNFRNTGKTALIFSHLEMPARAMMASYILNFQLRVGLEAVPGVNTLEAFFVWDNNSQREKGKIYASANEYTDALDLDGDGNTAEIFTRIVNSYVYAPAKAVQSEMMLSPDNGSAWLGAGDVGVDYGGDYQYKTTVYNGRQSSVGTVDTITVLPRVNDHAITPDTGGNYLPRGSQFDVYLTGPVATPAGYTVTYATVSQPTTLQDTVNVTWQPATAITDWSAVTMYRVQMNAGTTLGSIQAVSFTAPVKAPADRTIALGSLAKISGITFAHEQAGQTPALTEWLEYAGPNAKLQTYTLTGFAFGDINRDGLFKQSVAEAAYPGINVLVRDAANAIVKDPQGNELRGVTGANGKISFTLYARGVYHLEFETTPHTLTIQKTAPNSTTIASQADPATGLTVGALLNPVTPIQQLSAGYVYVSPKTAVTAAKVWVGGETVRPDVWFRLFYKANGISSAVPSAPLKKVPTSPPYVVTWDDMDINNASEIPYTYYVLETDSNGNLTTPLNFTKSEVGLTVTNTYVSPKTTLVGTKLWEAVPVGFSNPPVKLVLVRNGAVVPGSVRTPGSNGKVYWIDQPLNAPDGSPYAYSVDEETVPNGYVKTFNGMSLTNTYNGLGSEAPLSITAAKVWMGAPTGTTSYPPVELQLKQNGVVRQTITLTYPQINYVFTDLKRYDGAGNPFVYAVDEAAAPNGYTKSIIGDTIINTYNGLGNEAPVSVTATKVWAGADGSTRPNVRFVLKRNGAAVDEAIVVHPTTTASWNNLPKYAPNGTEYIYTVDEPTVPNGYSMASSGLTFTNTYTGGDVITVTANKTWVNGPTAKPSVWFKLFRRIENGPEEVLPDAAVQELSNGAPSVSWDNMTRYAPNGKEYTYFVKETDADGVPTQPTGYNKAEVGLNVTNQFAINKNGVAQATKVWVNGPAAKPTVWFKLYRNILNGAAETVPGVSVKELPNGTTEVSWTGLETTDLAGNAYTFSVKETNAEGGDFEPAGYTKLENGLTVTNTFIIPNTGTATANLEWVNGGTPRPTVWFQLWRKTASGAAEPAPDAAIKIMADGTLQTDWTGLAAMDHAGNAYTFSVKQTDASGNPLDAPNYTKSETGLTVTNTYVIPVNGVASATKTWTGGPTGSRPDVWFKLYRNIAGESPAEVPSAEIKKLPNGATSANWSGLEATDINGKPYTFTVKETNESGTDWQPENYQKAENGLNVTNTYVIPTVDTVTATKIWQHGDSLPRPTVWFQLWRKTASGVNEAVSGAGVTELTAGTAQATWTNLEKTNAAGEVYTFYVKETSGSGVDWVPDTYTKAEEGMTVTNTYVIPRNANPTATLIWEGGSTPRPTVYLQLMRKTASGADESVLVPQKMADGDSSYTWMGMEATNLNGEAYTYFVRETDVSGTLTTPSGYTKLENGLNVTNTYIIPNTGTATARKVWKGGSAPRPTVWFKLYRAVGEEDPAAVPIDEAPLKAVADGTTEAVWTGLSATNAAGVAYTFSVKETNSSGSDFVPANYEKNETGLTVTNTFVSPKISFTGKKVWAGVPNGVTPPTVHLILRRNGVVQGGSFLPNAAGEATWSDLDQYAPDGTEYVYTADEESVLNGYTKSISPDGREITNTYTGEGSGGELVSFTATKEWAGAPDGTAYPTITLELMRNNQTAPVATAELTNGTTTHTWHNLPKYAPDGTEYTYHVDEQPVFGYEKAISPDGKTVTNSYTGAPFSFGSYKTWSQLPENANGAPAAIAVMRDGVKVAEVNVFDDGNHGTPFMFDNLLKYKPNGELYTYRFVEESVPNGYQAYGGGGEVPSITNVYDGKSEGGKPGTGVKITAAKTWEGLPNGAAAPAITLYLVRNGEPLSGSEHVLPSGETSYSWTGQLKYAPDGTEYTYRVEERTLPYGYQKGEIVCSKVGADTNCELKNTYDGAYPGNLQSFTATKKWTGLAEGQIGAPVKLQLKQNGVNYGDPVSVADDGTHLAYHSWTNLAHFAPDSTVYTYSVTEVETPAGYTLMMDDTEHTLTNMYEPNAMTTTVNAAKIWAGLPDGANGAAARLQLTQNGANHGEPVKLTDDGSHSASHTWENLPKFASNGQPYAYRVTEPAVPNGYKATITNEESSWTVTNEYDGTSEGGEPGAGTSFTANKVWANVAPSVVKPDIRLALMHGGNFLDIQEVKHGTTSYTWTNLKKYAPDGTLIAYRVEEFNVPDGYTATYSADGTTVTNTYTGDVLLIYSLKKWRNLPPNTQGAPVTFVVRQDGNAVKRINVVDNGQYAPGEEHRTWVRDETLPAFRPTGERYEYTVLENPVPNGYKFELVSGELSSYINTYDGTTDGTGEHPDGATITATKEWKNVPVDAVMPKATLELVRNGVRTGQTIVLNAGDTQAQWTKQLIYAADGTKYAYSVEETSMPNGYEKSVSCAEIGFATNCTVTNTYNGTSEGGEPGAGTDFTVEKLWMGMPSGNGTDTTLTLMQGVTEMESVALADDGSHSAKKSWSGLKKYAPDGTAYVYTAVEKNVPAGYKLTVSADGKTFINTYDATGATVNFVVTKNWTGLPSGANGASVQVQLKQNGANYGEPITLTDSGAHSASRTWENLPKVASNGAAYAYTAEEVAVPNGYAVTSVAGENSLMITNTYNGGEKINVSVEKKWAGEIGASALPTVQVVLLRDGVGTGHTAEFAGAAGTHTWYALEKYAPNGQEYVYSVDEPTVPKGYKKSIEGNIITNTYDGTSEGGTDTLTDTFKVTKIWTGTGDAKGADVQVQLKRGAEDIDAPVTLKDDGTHIATHEWTNLKKFAPDGTAYVYTAVETTALAGYTTTLSNGTKTITNRYDPAGTQQTMSLNAAKTWTGLDTGETGAPATLQLMQNGTAYGAPKLLTDLGAHTAIAKWDSLPKLAPDGAAYSYTVEEAAIANGYKKTVSGAGEIWTVENAYDGTTDENGVTPHDPLTVIVTKVWVGGESAAVRPDVKITLFRNERIFAEKTLTGGATTATFDGLKIYAPDGTKYRYTVDELSVPNGYKKSVTGGELTWTVMNTYDGTSEGNEPTDGVSRTVTKVWAGLVSGNGADVQVQLKRGADALGAPVTLSDDGTHIASHTWDKLEKYAPNGTEYAYSVTEVAAPTGYALTMSTDGWTIVNTKQADPAVETTFTVTKVWTDLPAGAFGAEARVQLKRGTENIDTPVTLTDTGSHTASFTWDHLPMKALDGTPYVYTAVETVTPEGYTSASTPGANSLAITNTYTGGAKIEVTGKKVWAGIDAGTVTPNVTLVLAADGVRTDKTTALTSGQTEAKWSGLPTISPAGNPIVYSVDEVTVPKGYRKAITSSGAVWTITNTYDGTSEEPGSETVTAKKVWMNVPEGVTVPSVTLQLYRDDVVMSGMDRILNAGQTDAEWENLKVYAPNGVAYRYRVDELAAPSGYQKQVVANGNAWTIINAYQGGGGTAGFVVTAMKEWVNGDAESRPTVWFKLYRKADGGVEEAVADADVRALANGMTSVRWNGLAEFAPSGNAYTYFVKEVDVNGADFVPAGYTKSEVGLKVINTYIVSNNGVATGIKNWVGGNAANRPTVWFKLYRTADGGTAEAVPGAAVKELVKGVVTVSWGGLETTNSHGKPYTFSVKEVDASGAEFTPEGYTKAENGLIVTNTFQVANTANPKAIKTWVGGSAPRPTIWLQLRRQAGSGSAEAVADSIVIMANGATEHVWANQPATDASGTPYVYSVKEVDANGADFTPAGYKKMESGLNVTNTYVVPMDGFAVATKSWVKGPVGQRPSVWFKLYRAVESGMAEAVPGAEVKELPNGTMSVFWMNLARTDENGKPYVFSVKEVDASGAEFTPIGYLKAENGLTVTNTYVISTLDGVTGKKTWIGGAAARPAEIWFTLYRQIQGGAPSPAAGAPVMKLSTGTTFVNWSALDKTDENGNVYTYLVKETDADGNPLTIPNFRTTENGMSVTNEYVVPKDGTATATKVWVDGSAPRPTVWLKLFRKTEVGTLEAVPGAAVIALPDGTASASWNGLERTDGEGNPYVFSVKETDAAGTDLAFVPTDYEKTENGLTVTNKYVGTSNATARAFKHWVGGNAANRPSVWFQLYRAVEGGTAEVVPGAAIQELPKGTTEVLWTALDKVDGQDKPYTFTVKEVDAGGADFTPTNYQKVEAGLIVTNTYVPPVSGAATATLTWVGGMPPRSTVWFKLYREVAGGVAEPVDGAMLKELADGVTSTSWNGLTETDLNGKPYVFSVKQVDASGNPLILDGYVTVETGLNVTNTYQSAVGTVRATLEWVGGTTPRPSVWFQLYRSDDGSTSRKAIEKVDEPRELPDGTLEMIWTKMPVTDTNGKPYTYFVEQVTAAGDDFTPKGYRKEMQVLHVRNIWGEIPTVDVTAYKVWAGNGPDWKPTVWFQLYRNVEGGEAEFVPGAELKALKNGVTEVTWTGVEQQNANKAAYVFSVREVSSMGYDFELANYVKEENGLTVTNTYFFFPEGDELLLPNTGFPTK